MATTHLSWKPEETENRLVQMGMILQEILPSANDSSSRCILLGDFNATEDEPVICLISEHFRDAYRAIHVNEPGNTWDNKNPLTHGCQEPNRRMDYIFCSSSTNILTCDVVLNRPMPVYPSDHFGVMAELEW